MAYYPILGFLPDQDPASPGVLVETNDIIPTWRGVKAMPGNADAGIASLTTTVVGAISARGIGATSRVIAGTTTMLFEIADASWVVVTRGNGTTLTSTASAVPYSMTSDATWSFAEYGDTIICAQKGDKIQYTSLSAFANISDAPKANIVEVVDDFAFAFDTNDATSAGASFGDSPNRWWCSAAGNIYDWTPSIATQCASDVLVDTPGKIVAAKRVGHGCAVFKEKSTYFARYIGPPLVWGFDLVSREIGCISKDGAITVDNSCFFVGWEDFYVFDGTRPRAIGYQRVSNWFFSDLNADYRQRIKAAHDRERYVVYWWYPSTSSADGRIDSYIAYNYRGDRWAAGRRKIQYPLLYFKTGMTYDNLGTFYATYDDIPAFEYDSAFITKDKGQPANFVETTTATGSNKLLTMNDSASSSYLITGDYGTDDSISVVDRIRPRYASSPSTATMDHIVGDDAGSVSTTVSTVTMTNGRLDTVLASRWHRFKHNFTGDFELLGQDIKIRPDSPE